LKYDFEGSGAENALLQECPSKINCFDDIKPLCVKYKNDLVQSKKIFFEKLPTVIQKEKEKLEELKNNREKIEIHWEEKINIINKSLENNKWKIWKYIDLFVKKHISKPKAIRKAEFTIEQQKKVIYKLENDPESVFEREQFVLINDINHLERIISSPDYSGAYGELKVLKELGKLDDSYHVICDVNVSLRDYVHYRGNRNLKTAQMDFIVVGPTGIFVIEVKNWSSDHVNHHSDFSPHEQVDIAGLALWIYLKDYSFFFKPRVTKLLVPIQYNLSYDPYYKSVFIRDPQNLRKFILENSNTLSEKKINKVVSLLR
jgi:hypothetical protein